MANLLDIQITQDGPRNAIVKLTGTVDTENVAIVSAIALEDFLSNDPNLKLSGFRVDCVDYSLSPTLQALIAWDGVYPQQIYALAGFGEIGSKKMGGSVPDETREGYTGNINLYVTGCIPGEVQNFSILLEMIKLYRHG